MPKMRQKWVVRDVRLFVNSIHHAVDVMRRGGVEAESKKYERDGYIEYVIKIPR
jgi:ParB family chromosome partitioning protein